MNARKFGRVASISAVSLFLTLVSAVFAAAASAAPLQHQIAVHDTSLVQRVLSLRGRAPHEVYRPYRSDETYIPPQRPDEQYVPSPEGEQLPADDIGQLRDEYNSDRYTPPPPPEPYALPNGDPGADVYIEDTQTQDAPARPCNEDDPNC